MTKHLETRVDKEDAEETENPLKTLDHRRTSKDKDTAQHQCTEDAPEKYLVLVFALDTEE